MTYSQFTLTFNNDLSIGDEIVIRAGNEGTGIITAYREKWFNTRTQSNQVTLGAPTSNAGERSAINFVSAFSLDYNPPGTLYPEGVFEITRTVNVVVIKVRFPLFDFYTPTTPNPNDPNGPYPDLPDGVDLLIENYEGEIITIDSLTYSEATENPPCTHYKVTVETSILAVEVQYPNLFAEFIANEDNPFTFELMRGQQFSLVCKSADNQYATVIKQWFEVPQMLNSGMFTIDVVNSPNGATVTVNNTVYTSINNYEFSLDDVVYQTSNVFTGLGNGNYTVYIRDQFGCQTSLQFTITNGVARLPYYHVPKANSFRFANRITFGDCSNYKNDENTLSCEVDVLLPYKEIQLFQSCDVITTQFRSNYVLNTASVIDENGNETPISIQQMTQNIGITDSRDAYRKFISTGKAGIYFVSGNTYDYDTGVANGTYTLNGLLPEWAVAGNYFKIGTTWYLIEDIIYDESVNADVIIYSDTVAGTSSVIVGSIYNRENYEEYEFTIDLFDYLNQTIRVSINAVDNDFVPIEMLSELINVKVRQENTLEIRYKNSTNTDINYSRGLENKIRMLFTYINGRVLDESETFLTDTNAILLDSDIYELDEIVFEPITKEMMRKLVLALSHDTLMINGVSYVKQQPLEIEGALEDSNLYVVTALMIKASSPLQSTGNNSFDGSLTEIPGLVEWEDGFIQY